MNLRKKRTSLWKWIVAAAASLSFLVVLSCNTPFIPIPPPDPEFSQDPSGDWAVHMSADSRAIGSTYYIYNANLGSGLIQRAAPDGSVYARPLQGQAGDNVMIHWEKSENERSSTICRPLGQGLVRMVCQ